MKPAVARPGEPGRLGRHPQQDGAHIQVGEAPELGRWVGPAIAIWMLPPARLLHTKYQRILAKIHEYYFKSFHFFNFEDPKLVFCRYYDT